MTLYDLLRHMLRLPPRFRDHRSYACRLSAGRRWIDGRSGNRERCHVSGKLTKTLYAWNRAGLPWRAVRQYTETAA